ncbi:MAG: CPBP family intramembrane metalloprotease [Rhodobacteraceae bacterium]|nr:CPBP family intramembrane metalloprotease [Paracoccaceae bacterium]
MRNVYQAQARQVAALRSTAQPWRLLAGAALVLATVFALNLAIMQTLRSLAPGFARDIALANGGTPGSLLVLLTTFACITLAVALTVRLLHRRGLASVIGPAPRALRDFLRVLGALALLGVVLWVLPPWGTGLTLTPNLAPGLWLMLLPLSLAAVLIQTSAEEILFRGYLQQQLAARFANPLIWMVLPSVLFALGHYLPAQAGPNAWMIAAWSGMFGLLMADLTARAGNLGPAVAVHFANNLSSLLIVSLPDAMNGLSLYTVGFRMDDPDAIGRWLPVEFATMIVGWLAARLAIRR